MENWAWGLSLIASTITIHAGGVALMAFVHLGIRVRLERENRLKLPQAFTTVIGLIGSAGLLLAVLHGIEAGGVLVARRAQFTSRGAALLCRFDQHPRRFGPDVREPLANDGCIGGGRRYAAVRHQYGVTSL